MQPRKTLGLCGYWLLATMAAPAASQTPTVGLLHHDPRAWDGYTLFSPNGALQTYLIDLAGRQIHSWNADASPGLSAYLLDDGNLLRTANPGPTARFMAGGSAGRLDRFDWDGNLQWQFTYSSNTVKSHHDVEPLPNGNVLMIAWELKTSAEAIAAGRNPALLSGGELWPDHIIEIQPTPPVGGVIVWEWHVWDHLIQDFAPSEANYGVVADYPELVDINAVGNPGADWLHTNAVDYNPELDQILLSVHNLSEIWVIDHSTTTAEASGHSGGRYGRGGDLLYRWGNPRHYDAGVAADQQLYVQHDARWIEPGLPGESNILVFNNGTGRPGGNASSVDEIVPPYEIDGSYRLTPGTAYGPAAPIWTYQAPVPTDLYAMNISGATRLPTGATLICDGPAGDFFEVTDPGELLWRYVNPRPRPGPLQQGAPTNNTAVFRAERYPRDHPAFDGRDLTPTGPIETYPCATSPTVLYAIKLPADEVSLTWDTPCTTRWLRQTTVREWASIGPVVAGSTTTELTVQAPTPPLYWTLQ